MKNKEFSVNIKRKNAVFNNHFFETSREAAYNKK